MLGLKDECLDKYRVNHITGKNNIVDSLFRLLKVDKLQRSPLETVAKSFVRFIATHSTPRTTRAREMKTSQTTILKCKMLESGSKEMTVRSVHTRRMVPSEMNYAQMEVCAERKQAHGVNKAEIKDDRI